MAYRPEQYIHDLDARAFDMLNTFPKAVKLYELYKAGFDEKAAKIELLSSSIRLGEEQMPEIYGLLPPICEKLGIEIPELYYRREKAPNAWTSGKTFPYIVVTSGLVNRLSPELLSTVLAHECGHIACGHSLYHSLAMLLIRGIDNGPLAGIPGIRRLAVPALKRAFLFWDRCSELTADRAAALCDGGADRLVDMLLRLDGYGNGVDRQAFMKQAMDLRAFVDDSSANKLIEQMVTQEDTHPRLATRAYECCEWAKSERFRDIISGKLTVIPEEPPKCETTELISAEITPEATERPGQDIDSELRRVNAELEKVTSRANRAGYALAIGCGVLAGVVDSAFIGKFTITNADIKLSHKQVNEFIQKYAAQKGYTGERLDGAIAFLEEQYPVIQDNVWKGAGVGITPKNHHLADFAHHPTPLGLVSAIGVQLLRVGTFVNKDGEWHFFFMKPSAEDVFRLAIPAVITGFLHWLVCVGENKLEEINGEVPDELVKIARVAASMPAIIEVVRIADNWFGHLVSDMGGSKNTAGGGMGIPGIFISLLHELSSVPILKYTALPQIVNDLYTKNKLDLRHELPMYKALGRQAVPVLLNEVLVRTGCFISQLVKELKRGGSLGRVDWSRVVPFGNRTAERMVTVASMTFTLADTADAAFRAALESGGNWVMFAGNFVARYNYVGAGRAVVAVIREISGEKKETQLLHEKLALVESKTENAMRLLQDYKAELERRLSEFLAEDLERLMEGLDDMEAGVASGESEPVIRGSVTIQRVLGREPQFENQAQFDDLMESDMPLKF